MKGRAFQRGATNRNDVLQVVCTVSASVQLLGVGLSGGDAPFTAHLELEEVEHGPAPEDAQNGLDPEASDAAAQTMVELSPTGFVAIPCRARCRWLPGLAHLISAGVYCSDIILLGQTRLGCVHL